MRILKFTLSPLAEACAINRASIAYVPDAPTVNLAVEFVKVILRGATLFAPVAAVNASYRTDAEDVSFVRVRLIKASELAPNDPVGPVTPVGPGSPV